MNATIAKKKTEPEAAESAVAHPLLERPIPHAYALIEQPGRPGRFYAVHLTDVLAKGIDFLEPSQRSEPATYGLVRIARAQDRRHKEKRWTR